MATPATPWSSSCRGRRQVGCTLLAKGADARTSATPALLVEELSGAYFGASYFVAALEDIVGFSELPGGGDDEIHYLISGARPATGRGRTSAGTLHLRGSTPHRRSGMVSCSCRPTAWAPASQWG